MEEFFDTSIQWLEGYIKKNNASLFTSATNSIINICR